MKTQDAERKIKKLLREINLKKKNKIIYLNLNTLVSKLTLRIILNLKEKLNFSLNIKKIDFVDRSIKFDNDAIILLPIAQEHLFPILVGKILDIKDIEWIFSKNVWVSGLYLTEKEISSILKMSPVYSIFSLRILDDLMNFFLQVYEINPKYGRTMRKFYLAFREDL